MEEQYYRGERIIYRNAVARIARDAHCKGEHAEIVGAAAWTVTGAREFEIIGIYEIIDASNPKAPEFIVIETWAGDYCRL